MNSDTGHGDRGNAFNRLGVLERLPGFDPVRANRHTPWKVDVAQANAGHVSVFLWFYTDSD